MMANDPAGAPLTGEQRHRARFNAFLRYCVIALLVGLIAGVASGLIGGMVKDGLLPSWLVYKTTVVLIAGFLWFMRDYLRRVDELDLLDNLWAGLIGFTFYYLAFPVWNLLESFDLAPPVNNWWLWIGTTIVMFAAYLLRKAGVR